MKTINLGTGDVLNLTKVPDKMIFHVIQNVSVGTKEASCSFSIPNAYLSANGEQHTFRTIDHGELFTFQGDGVPVRSVQIGISIRMSSNFHDKEKTMHKQEISSIYQLTNKTGQVASQDYIISDGGTAAQNNAKQTIVAMDVRITALGPVSVDVSDAWNPTVTTNPNTPVIAPTNTWLPIIIGILSLLVLTLGFFFRNDGALFRVIEAAGVVGVIVSAVWRIYQLIIYKK